MTPLQKILAERESKMYRYYESVFKDGYEGGYPKEYDLPLETYIKQYARSIVEQSVPERDPVKPTCWQVAQEDCRAQTLSNADNLLK